MSRLGPVDLQRGDLEVLVGDANIEIVGARTLDPILEIVGIRRHGCEPRPDLFQLLREAADDCPQSGDLVVVIVLGGDFLRHDLVVLRLRFVSVGDCRHTHFEVALRLRQRLDHGFLLAVRKLDVELRQQHVEIGGGNAQDQVLPGELENVVRLVDLLFRLVQRNDVLIAEQRLRGRDERVVLSVAMGDVGLGVGLDGRVVLVSRRARGHRRVRQQARARLRHGFLRGLPIRLRRCDGGVVGDGLAVDLHQIFAAGGGRKGSCGEPGGQREGNKRSSRHLRSLSPDWLNSVSSSARLRPPIARHRRAGCELRGTPLAAAWPPHTRCDFRGDKR